MPPTSAVRLAAVAVAVALGGCAAREALQTYGAAESAEVAAAPYPDLADTPEPPPPGEFSAAIPDPATGDAIVLELGDAAARSAIRRAEAGDGPLLDDAFTRLLRSRGAPGY